MQIHCKYDELVDPKTLKFHPKNANKHDKDQIKRLGKILEYQGWRYPIKVSKQTGYITSGHGRVLTALDLGYESVPVNYQDYETTDQEIADVHSDNAIASWASLELKDINDQLKDFDPSFDIDLLGIKDFVLEPADKYSEANEDEVPEVKEPISKLGDLYELGNHRLLCGDSTMIDDIIKLTKENKMDMLCWDPPWNVNFEYNQYKDDKTTEEYQDFLFKCISNFITVANNDYCSFVWQSEKNWKNFHIWFSPWDPRIAVVAKNFVQAAKWFINRSWDPVLCWHGHEYQGRNNINFRDYFLSNTANTKQTEDRIISGGHPCPRNVDAVEYFLGWKPVGSNIMDLSGGSGTALIACEKTNRKCFMMELDPHYIDVIVTRYCKYTGNNKIKRNGEEITWQDHVQK